MQSCVCLLMWTSSALRYVGRLPTPSVKVGVHMKGLRMLAHVNLLCTEMCRKTSYTIRWKWGYTWRVCVCSCEPPLHWDVWEDFLHHPVKVGVHMKGLCMLAHVNLLCTEMCRKTSYTIWWKWGYTWRVCVCLLMWTSSALSSVGRLPTPSGESGGTHEGSVYACSCEPPLHWDV